MHDSFQALLSFVIPEGVSDYFKLASYTKEDRVIGSGSKVVEVKEKRLIFGALKRGQILKVGDDV